MKIPEISLRITGKIILALKKLVPLLLLNIGGPMALCVLIADTKRPITWPNAEFMNVVSMPTSDLYYCRYPVSLHQRATCEVVLGYLSHSF